MYKSSIENYIVEQILILEKKEDLNENKKALLSLGILGMLGAFIAKGNTPVETKSSSSIEQTVANAYKQKTGSRLTRQQREQIKKGKELASRLTRKEVNDIAESEPAVGQAFYALFKDSNKERINAKLNPKNKDTPIASIEGINVDDIFVYTQSELDQYFRKEANRSILELEDGTNILDMTPEELNNNLSDQTSEVVKLIAEEMLTSALVQAEVSMAVIEAFSANPKGTYEEQMGENLDILEIKARHEPEMLRVKALQHWLKNNIKSKEASRTIEDIKSAGYLDTQEKIDSWIERYNSGGIPDEYTGKFEDDDRKTRSASDYEEVADFLQ